MSSGRPVLFVPYTGSFPDVGERSIVAWDENCETARRSPPSAIFGSYADRQSGDAHLCGLGFGPTKISLYGIGNLRIHEIRP
ncbi:MAG: hypothetical protein QOF74_9514 [Caballeronia mineralivorans]|nr:hypothetical protein [Caballeronia mineralivorans]